ncbi:DNA primase DnaG [Legionella birminghamensis]|uniref:DNA primase n=1 Tax=Legionella birminghamensis TaxID=28083 RepID=A0A378IKU1_9GAMM|nr:DNA primase [Legionella birminghamensis]KTC75518.1 DNA primase DnaG [Legionella birminghamensis]STX32744.1 DNA primase DnaG [Legionella birminghamensis]
MSGLIPRPFIDELLSRTDLVELIDHYVPLKKRGNSYIACCPFHNEKTPSFNVVAKKQFFHCFGCGSSGNAISFIMSYLNQNFTDAVETLAVRLGMAVPKEQESHGKKQGPNLYQLLARVTQHYQKRLKTPSAAEAVKYLQQRGLTGEIAKQFQIGYAPSDWSELEKTFPADKKGLIETGMLIRKDTGKTYDRYRNRIMFPIHDRQGKIIGFGGRAISPDQQPKYLNSPETVLFQKNRELYGLYQVLQQSRIEQIIVVEGYLDVIALAQHGINNSVAALGTATSAYHVQLLSKHCKQLIFCFDGDNAGRQAAWRALENSLAHLNSGMDVRFVFLPEGQDPDSFVRKEGREKFIAILQSAIPLHEYFIATLSENLDLHSLSGKSQLINLSKPYLVNMPEGGYKQLLINELAQLTRLENHRIELVVAENNSAAPAKPKKGISRSPIRLAIALLIQNPEIYSETQQQIKLELLDGKEQKLLKQLIEQIASKPEVTTASLIELWRDSPFFDSLNKLAAWDHQVPDEALVKEFLDIINFLQKQNRDNKINQFLEKSRKEGLTHSEQIELQNLLKQRHQNGRDKN